MLLKKRRMNRKGTLEKTKKNKIKNLFNKISK